MSFFENPIVDNNSKLSEESVNAVRSLFTRKKGFICREENPDYGVDLDLELIDDKSQASGNKFPIQIKSSVSIKTVVREEIKFVSQPFLTSRLGYLAKRKPSYGIIVIYNEENEICYFDYVEDLIERISNQKENNNWKQQKYINLNIPYSNTLNDTSVKEIYRKYCRRFKNFSLLLSNHGYNYEIPVFDKEQSLSSKEILLMHGGTLLNNCFYGFIDSHISKIPRNEILASKKLLLLAGINYVEIGDMIEAKYYLSKVKGKVKEFDQTDADLFILLKSKVAFLSGNISIDELEQNIEKIYSKSLQYPNLVSFKVQKMKSNLLQNSKKMDFPETVDKTLLEIYEKIIKVNDHNNIKYLLLLSHSETVFQFAVDMFFTNLFKQHFNIPTNDNLKIRFNDLETEANKYLKIVEEKSIKSGSTFLQSNVNTVKVKYFIDFWTQNLMMFPNQILIEDVKNTFHKNFNMAISAHNTFVNDSYYIEAYRSINFAIELKKIYYHFYHQDIPGVELPQLQTIADEIVETKGLKPYYSAFDEYLTNKKR